jgi:hypothetical protein
MQKVNENFFGPIGSQDGIAPSEGAANDLIEEQKEKSFSFNNSESISGESMVSNKDFGKNIMFDFSGDKT